MNACCEGVSETASVAGVGWLRLYRALEGAAELPAPEGAADLPELEGAEEKLVTVPEIGRAPGIDAVPATAGPAAAGPPGCDCGCDCWPAACPALPRLRAGLTSP